MVFDIREDEVDDHTPHWTLPDMPIFCRPVQCPPREIELSGHEGKPRDMNGRFQLLPHLHEGRPAYQRQGSLWTIRWYPMKCRWLIDQEGLNTHDQGVARAVCNAPNPVSVPECGGFWECHRATTKRGIQVTVSEDLDGRGTGPIEEEEFRTIIARTLKKSLEAGQDMKRLTVRTRDPQHPSRFTDRFHVERVTAAARTLDAAVTEARIFGLPEDVVAEAYVVRRRLAGWLLIEDLAAQVDQPRDKQTFQSWVDLLKRVKHRVRGEGADPNVTNDMGWTPLHFVVRYGLNEAWTNDASQILVEAKANLDQLDFIGMSPILLAAAARQRENCRALLKIKTKRAETLPLELYGYSQNAGVEFLHEAANGELADIRPFVLAKTVDLDYRDMSTGQTAMHLASERNKAGMVDLLAREKANVNITDKQGRCPLHVATKVNSQICVMVLLRNGASPNIRDDLGCTPYMISLEMNAGACNAEFQKHMAQWTEIEEILGKERTMEAKDWRDCTRKKVNRLVELGFGDVMADPLNVKDGEYDRLQIANQIVVRDPDSEGQQQGACIVLEPRGVILCKELLKPLLMLAAECQLELPDFVKYKHFTRYLLMSGISVFAGVEIVFAVQSGIEALDKHFATEYEYIRPELKDLTDAKKGNQAVAQQFFGRARSWRCYHQFFAHGKLNWLSPTWDNRSTLGALAALVEADCFPTVQDVCEFAMPEEFNPLENGTAPPASSMGALSAAPQPVPNVAASQGGSVPASQATSQAGSRRPSASVEVDSLGDGSPKFGPPGETSPTSGGGAPSGSPPAKPAESLANPSTDGAGQLAAPAPAPPSTLHKSTTGIQQNNMMIQFWDSVYARWLLSCARKIDHKVQMFARDKWGVKHRAGPLKDQRIVLEHKDKYREMSNENLGRATLQADMPTSHPFEAGGFTDLCRFSVLCDGVSDVRDIVTGMKASIMDRDGFELVSINNGWALAKDEREYKDVKLGLLFEAPGGSYHIVECQLTVRKCLNIRRHQHLLQTYENGEYVEANNKMRQFLFERVKGTGTGSNEQKIRFCTGKVEQVVWWWAPDFRVKEGGYLEVPWNALTLSTGMDAWEELMCDGQPAEDPSLESVCTEEAVEVDVEQLKDLLDHDEISMEDGEIERLRVELVTGGARLFRDPTGRLTKMKDYVQLRVLSPTRDSFLIRETQPRGFVCGLRNSKESIGSAARRVTGQSLPKCIALCIIFQDFHKDDGVWITPQAGEDGTLRSASRTFVVRATFVEEPEPFALLQAGLLDY
jgi:ankyrin repeat protein